MSDQKNYRLVSKLHEWSENPKIIDEDSLVDLTESIRLKGQIQTLLVMPDGTVLGGSQRLKAMRKAEVQLAEVTEIDFIQTPKGKWQPILEGVAQQAIYETKEDAMWDYAVAHNSEYGKYDKTKLATSVAKLNINLNALRVSVRTLPVDQAIKVKVKDPIFNVIVPCETEEEKETLKRKLADLGIRTK